MKNELVITRVCLALTLGALVMVYQHIAAVTLAGSREWMNFFQAATVALLITALVYGSLVYLVARLGYLRRQMNTADRTLDQLEDTYLTHPGLPCLCVLIPSYKEELRVVRQTIVSAALSVYGARRIVVLIDDSPRATGKDLESLQRTRELVALFHRQFHGAAARVRARYSEFLMRRESGVIQSAVSEMDDVAGLYESTAQFIETLVATGHEYLAAYWIVNFGLLAAGFFTFIDFREAWGDIALALTPEPITPSAAAVYQAAVDTPARFANPARSA